MHLTPSGLPRSRSGVDHLPHQGEGEVPMRHGHHAVPVRTGSQPVSLWTAVFAGAKPGGVVGERQRLVLDISACPGAAMSSARSVSGVIAERGGKFSGSWIFFASPSQASTRMKS